MKKRIRYAVVGLGHIAQTAVLPAFAHTENSELAALVTGTPQKAMERLLIRCAMALSGKDYIDRRV